MSDKNASKPRVVLMGGSEVIDIAFPKDMLAGISHRVEVLDPPLTGENWRDHPDVLSRADFIFSTWGMPVMDHEFLLKAPALQAVFYAAGTVKGFVTPESFDRGIRVSNANQANAIPVAEYAVSAIILSLKRFWQHALQNHRAHSWVRLDVPGAYRAIVGLVSLGAVGRITAKKLASFELEVIAYDPFATEVQAAELGVKLVSLEEIFRRSDVVSLHAPWLPETENMVDGRILRLMKNGATLLNTSRGAVINEGEMCEVLRERPDLTAVLDVTHPEPPLPDSPLYQLDNVFLTPHISGSMGGEISRMGRWMVDELERFLDGQPLSYEITREQLSTAA